MIKGERKAMKNITLQTVHSTDFKEKCLDEIHRKIKYNMIVFGQVTANEMKIIIQESLNDYIKEDI